MNELVKNVLDDFAISKSLYIRSIVSELSAIIIFRLILLTRLILSKSSIEISQIATQVETSCTFVISADHQRLISSDSRSRHKLCKIDSASLYEKSFQKKHRAFADFQATALPEGKH